MKIYKLTKLSNFNTLEPTFERYFTKFKYAKEYARINHRLHLKRGASHLSWGAQGIGVYSKTPIMLTPNLYTELHHQYIITQIKVHDKAPKR